MLQFVVSAIPQFNTNQKYRDSVLCLIVQVSDEDIEWYRL